MSEQPVATEAVTTGHPQVDDVLGSLDTLAGLPIEQHVEVFEAAHLALRNALSGAQAGAQQDVRG